MGLLRWVPLIYTAIFTIAFVFIGLKSALIDLEPNNCKMTYMWPQYVPVKGMKHPKYDLYYYREGETKSIQSIPKLSGVPVLFIPGNAGSYRQVRSLGSVSAWTYSSRNLSAVHDSDLKHVKLQAPPYSGTKLNEFDFFTADFDEELTALNGDLLFKQIDFINDCINHILSLYQGDKGQKPTSVVLVGHSMGGLVARGAFTATNYTPGSIKTIITINSPHRMDPVLFHRSSGKAYRIVNGFWQEELYNTDKRENSALKDVAILSIAGGNRDIQVSSDLSSLELIVPETHQFSTIATSVPNVWLSTDHLSSVWCNQLVFVLSETLFALIDPATRQDTYPLEERIKIFKQNFQSKLPEALSFVDALPDLHRSTVQDTEKWIGRPYAEAFVHHHTITQTKHMKWHISENYHEYKYTMVTGLLKENISAKLCKTDFVDCLDLSDKITPVMHSVEQGMREFDASIIPMNVLVLMPDALKGYDYLLVEVQPPKDSSKKSFFIAQWYGLAESRIDITPPMFKEYNINLPKQHPIIVDFVFENLSKFQALTFKIARKECMTTIKQVADDLKSVVVQFNEETKEEKHSSLPATVIKYEICSQNRTQCFNNIHALFFSHPGCEYEIEISPNIFESLGQVFRSYLMLGIACCFAATFFIMFQQFRLYRKTGVYPSLWESLRDVHYNYVTVIFVGISFVDVVIGPIFTETVFTLTSEFLRHGLLTLPYPWPSLPILFMLHFLAISIVGIWYLATCLLYSLLTFRIGFTDVEKPRAEKFSITFTFVAYMAIIFGSFFFLHYSVTLIIALIYFLLSMKYYQNRNKWHFAQSLFVLYSFLLIIVIPSLIIWVKDLKYGWNWPDKEYAVLLIAIHIYVVRFMQLPTGKSISYLMLLASAAVELACLHTVYRMMSVLIGVTLVFFTMPLFNKPSNKKDGDYNNRKETKKKEDRKESKKSFKSKPKQQNNK